VRSWRGRSPPWLSPVWWRSPRARRGGRATSGRSGIVGFVLLGGLLTFLLLAAVARSLRAAPELRIWIAAAAVGGLPAFLTSAAFEWVWEMAAIAWVVMLLGAVVVAGRGDGEIDDEPAAQPRPRILPRAVLALLAVVATGSVAVPMADALRPARATTPRPREISSPRWRTPAPPSVCSPTPRLQQALVLRGGGRAGRRRQSGARGDCGGADQLAPVLRAGADRRAARRGRLRGGGAAPCAQPEPAIAARGQAMHERRDIRLDLEPDAPDELVSLAERLERRAAAARGRVSGRAAAPAAVRSRRTFATGAPAVADRHARRARSKGALGEILGLAAVAQAVGEEAVDLDDVLVVDS
jgi:hypothetical protein